jgi:RNA recognition motif-containing protein
VEEHKGKEKKMNTKKKAGTVHTVFVGNIAKETTEQELKERFLEFGTIKRVSFAKDGEGVARGFGHVEFDDAAGKEAALKMSRQVDLHGCQLSVRKATVGGSKNKKSGDKKGKSGAGAEAEGDKKKMKRKRAGKGRFKGRPSQAGGEGAATGEAGSNRSSKKMRTST